MARTVLVVIQGDAHSPLSMSAVEVAGDVANDVALPNDGLTKLYARNAGAGSHVLTFRTPGTVRGLAIAEDTVTIVAGAHAILGFFDRDLYNQPDGSIYIDSDGTKTEMKYAGIR